MYNKYVNFFTKNIAYINFTISSCALIFQITVLNPWHYKLDKKIDNIIKNKN